MYQNYPLALSSFKEVHMDAIYAFLSKLPNVFKIQLITERATDKHLKSSP